LKNYSFLKIYLQHFEKKKETIIADSVSLFLNSISHFNLSLNTVLPSLSQSLLNILAINLSSILIWVPFRFWYGSNFWQLIWVSFFKMRFLEHQFLIIIMFSSVFVSKPFKKVAFHFFITNPFPFFNSQHVYVAKESKKA
jgi:hypothetical protein